MIMNKQGMCLDFFYKPRDTCLLWHKLCSKSAVYTPGVGWQPQGVKSSERGAHICLDWCLPSSR
jgi:hypothetical protein